MLATVKDFLQQNIYPHIYAFYAEKILKNKVHELKVNFKITEDQNLNEFIKELEDYHKKEVERKKLIEDKAKSSLFVIAISVTLILGSLNFFRDIKGEPNFLYIISLFSLFLGLIYLLLSGISSIQALTIKEFYDIYVDDRIEVTEGIQNIKNFDIKDQIEQIYKNIKLNQSITNIRSNYVSATFIGIRNGIILMSLFFIIAAGTVENNLQPLAVISASPTSIIEGENISLNGINSKDIDGYIASYQWDLGDGNSTAGASISHIYYKSGIYTILLTVTDNNGAKAIDSIKIEVKSPINKVNLSSCPLS